MLIHILRPDLNFLYVGTEDMAHIEMKSEHSLQRDKKHVDHHLHKGYSLFREFFL